MEAAVHREWHQDFQSRGFYDGGQHIAIFPTKDPPIYTLIAHETTHAKIVSNSSLGFIMQIAHFIDKMGRLHGSQHSVELARQVNELVGRASNAVHEAAAWLVSAVVTDPGYRLSIPDVYRDDALHLRQIIQSMPGFTFGSLEGCQDDFDPLFRSPVLLIQAIASFALSPHFVEATLKGEASDFVIALSRGLSSETSSPKRRYDQLVEQISTTHYDVAKSWTRWVRRWQFGPSQGLQPLIGKAGFIRRLLNLAPAQLGHCGHIRSSISTEQLADKIFALTKGEIGGKSETFAQWDFHYEKCRFEPHVDPYLQVCLLETPQFKRPVFYKGSDAYQDLAPIFRYVNIKQGGEDFFKFKRAINGEVEIHFGPSPEGDVIIWKVDRPQARSFLEKWSRDQKGIVTSSILYDFSLGDVEGGGLLYNLPHAVVSVTDFHSLWTKICSGDYGFMGCKRPRVGFSFLKRVPEDFGFLLMFPEGPFPLIFMPCLFRTAQRILSAPEELLSPAGFGLIQLEAEEAESLVDQCGLSASAAVELMSQVYSPIRADY